MLANYLIPFKI